MRKGTASEIKEALSAAISASDVEIDVSMSEALIEARDDRVLAPFVDEIGGRRGLFPACLLNTLVEADWEDAVALYRDGDDASLDALAAPTTVAMTSVTSLRKRTSLPHLLGTVRR
jgi:hypothetical protein